MVKKYIVFIWAVFLISLSYGQVSENELMITDIEESPFFSGDLKEFIQNEILYPRNAEIDSIEGTVIISFKIDTLGLTNNHKVVKGVREDLNNEALRVARLIKFEKPAFQKGVPIKVKYTVPVLFSLTNLENKSRCRNHKTLLMSKQVDTLECEKYFEYYESLLEDRVIIIWETPPSINIYSQEKINVIQSIIKTYTCYEYLVVRLIIDPEGVPICYRFNEKLRPDIKKRLIDKLRELRFNPAQQRGRGVISIYSLIL